MQDPGTALFAKLTRPFRSVRAQQRRKKDRNAPKRPRNAYLVFLDRHRPAKQAANPTGAMKARQPPRSRAGCVRLTRARAPQDLTREMAKEWKDVSAEEKKICDDIAAQNKLDYDEAMKAYQATHGHAGAMGGQSVTDGGDEVRPLLRGAACTRSTACVLRAGRHVSFCAAGARVERNGPCTNPPCTPDDRR